MFLNSTSRQRDWLKQQHPETRTEGGDEVRLCHNLDFATSGVIVAAKSRAAADAVSRTFREREARKLYAALVLQSYVLVMLFTLLQADLVAERPFGEWLLDKWRGVVANRAVG